MSTKLTYTGGQVEHPEPEEKGVKIQWIKGLQDIEPGAGTNEAVARYLANRLITGEVHASNFTHLPEWELFNACSIDIRLRVFELMEQIAGRATTEIADNQRYRREQMQLVLAYVTEHQAALSATEVQGFVEDLAQFELDSVEEWGSAVEDEGAPIVANEELDFDVVSEKLAFIVQAAYKASVGSGQLFKWYKAACEKCGLGVSFTVTTFQSQFESFGLADPDC